MKHRILLVCSLFVLLLLNAGCPGCSNFGPLEMFRGWESTQPPVHINPNMDTQEKLKPFRGDDFFADGSGMRTPPAGTIARTVEGNAQLDADFVAADDHYYRGFISPGKTGDALPAGIKADDATMKRGQERYNVFCAPCHAAHGKGNGTVSTRMVVAVPTFHDAARYALNLGDIFRVITHGKPLPELLAKDGVPNMPSYAAQIPVKDRWAIALYVRALQHTTHPGALPEGGTPELDSPESPADGEAETPAPETPAPKAKEGE